MPTLYEAMMGGDETAGPEPIVGLGGAPYSTDPAEEEKRRRERQAQAVAPAQPAATPAPKQRTLFDEMMSGGPETVQTAPDVPAGTPEPKDTSGPSALSTYGPQAAELATTLAGWYFGGPLGAGLAAGATDIGTHLIKGEPQDWPETAFKIGAAMVVPKPVKAVGEMLSQAALLGGVTHEAHVLLDRLRGRDPKFLEPGFLTSMAGGAALGAGAHYAGELAGIKPYGAEAPSGEIAPEPPAGDGGAGPGGGFGDIGPEQWVPPSQRVRIPNAPEDIGPAEWLPPWQRTTLPEEGGGIGGRDYLPPSERYRSPSDYSDIGAEQYLPPTAYRPVDERGPVGPEQYLPPLERSGIPKDTSIIGPEEYLPPTQRGEPGPPVDEAGNPIEDDLYSIINKVLKQEGPYAAAERAGAPGETPVETDTPSISPTRDAVLAEANRLDTHPASDEIIWHGTTPENAASIQQSGEFAAGPYRAHQFDYSEFHPDAVYGSRDKPGEGWFGEEMMGSVPYNARIPFRLDPRARIFKVTSDADLETLAKEAGFADADTMLQEMTVQGLHSAGEMERGKPVPDWLLNRERYSSDQEMQDSINNFLQERTAYHENLRTSTAARQKLRDAGVDVLDIELTPNLKKVTGNQVVVLNPEMAHPLSEADAALVRGEPGPAQETAPPPRTTISDLLKGWTAEQARKAAQAGESPATLEDILKGQKGGIKKNLLFAGGRAIGGGLYGYTQGDTEEERLKNAALYATGAALASPTLAMRGARAGWEGVAGRKPPDAARTTKAFGQIIRKVDHELHGGTYGTDFQTAFETADMAEARLPEVVAALEKAEPNKRLFKVISEAFLGDEPLRQATNEMTVSAAGRLLQRYSWFSTQLKKLAAEGDKDAQKLLNNLELGGDGPIRKTMDAWRASLVGRVGTGVRNAEDQSFQVGVGGLSKVMQGAAEQAFSHLPDERGILQNVLYHTPGEGLARGAQDAVNLGEAAWRRAKNGLGELTHMAQGRPDELDGVLAHFPKAAEKINTTPEGITRPSREAGAGEYAKYLRDKYGETINKVNNVQEGYFRRTWFETSLRNQLERAGIDADSAFQTPSMIPEKMVQKAVTEALKNTFQNTPRNGLARAIVKLGVDFPILHGLLPFPRYLANRLEHIVDHNPAAIARLFTVGVRRSRLQNKITESQELLDSLQGAVGQTERGKVLQAGAERTIERAQARLEKLDTPGEITGKWAAGTTLFAAGVVLRTSEFAGDHWYQVRKPGSQTQYDMSAFPTLAVPMFMAEAAKEMIQNGGHLTMSSADIAKGFALMGTRAGVGLTVFNKLMSGRESLDDFKNVTLDLIGSFGAGFFNPIGQSKDIVGMFNPDETLRRDTQDDAWMRLYGPTVNQFPGLRSRLLPQAVSPTSDEAPREKYPWLHFLGQTVDTPSVGESELASHGVSPWTIWPRETDKERQRTVAEGQGETFAANIDEVLNSADYNQASNVGQKMMLEDILLGSRGVGRERLSPLQEEQKWWDDLSPDMRQYYREQGVPPPVDRE